MAKYMFIGAAIIVGVVLVIALFINNGGEVLHVNQVGADPGAFTGTITVTGIAAGTAKDNPTVFGMFDLKELQCKTPNCNKLYLPVKYQGTMPKPGDEVRVTGSIIPMGGGYLFAAQQVTVVKNHRIGG